MMQRSADAAGQTGGSELAAGPARVVALLARDIKLSHSVFALPFALLAVALAAPTEVWRADTSAPGASGGLGRLAGQLALVVVCMVLARSWAMVVNRVLDADVDAQNARTRRRAVASGAVRRGAAWTTAAVCAVLFVLATAGFGLAFANWWPLVLSVPVLGWLAFYSLTKRFTALCHLVLGSALALSPVAAVIAIDPTGLAQAWPWLLAGFVACWVAGFDVIYALQDERFDRSRGLRSIPSALGPRGAVRFSRALHALALAVLVVLVVVEARLGVLFACGVALVAGLLAWEHALVAQYLRNRQEHHVPASDDPPPALNMAFFTLNGVVSCVLGVLGIAEALWRA